ncbi:uncharacterized protein LOC127249334 isoform X2 [Andrographis paniculata]|uniref:uncharacterized protein LOC127249334 isoform X2 n=1 Tax=Andrographis paniculata TaxID=175694 RepID=UPI0021E70E5A|nr:uncharacterized protein LOC127249334 isoform X2 [Andrographis paniculata]
MTPEGCENRWTDIRSQCTKWTTIRVQAQPQCRSGWSPTDFESYCHHTFLEKHKKDFKFESCWHIVKDQPKWLEFAIKKKDNKSDRCSEVEKEHLEETPGSGNVDEPFPKTSVDSSTVGLQTGQDANARAPSLSDLGGPAVIDLERPIGVKRAKTGNKKNNQKKRRLQRLEDSQASVAKNITAGLMTMDSTSRERWSAFEAFESKKEEKNDRRYERLLIRAEEEHKMKMAREAGLLTKELEDIGEKVIVAWENLKELDPNNLLTEVDVRRYTIRKQLRCLKP